MLLEGTSSGGCLSGGSQVAVSHTIRTVKGLFVLDMGNVEGSISVIPNMIIAHTVCVHIA